MSGNADRDKLMALKTRNKELEVKMEQMSEELVRY